MPTFKRGNATIYYEDSGIGEPIIANHGLAENANYWSIPGVTQNLAKNYRVLSMDMRGHGHSTVEGDPKGFDPTTVGDDIGALAGHLELKKFHLLSHATGGVAAVRYAMGHSDRLISLMLTNTSSAAGIGPNGMPEAAARMGTKPKPPPKDWTEWADQQRDDPSVYLESLNKHSDPDKMWTAIKAIYNRGDLASIGIFVFSFYQDPDPHIDGLRKISCPTLIHVGEHDEVFVPTSKLMAKEIPDAKLVISAGLSHMMAVEDPAVVIRELEDFLESVKKTGKAGK